MTILSSAPDTGENYSFSAVLPRLLPKISALAGGFSGAQDREDMIQEGLIALSDACQSFDAEKGVPFDAYAMTCVRRRMISLARKVARQRRAELPMEQAAPLSGGDPEEKALSAERLAALRKLLGEFLSEFEQKVFSLHLAGYSYRAIAVKTGKSEKSVGNAIARAKSKLSRLLS